MLEIRHLSVAYAGSTAVEDVSLRVSEGEVVALVGESGSGKTTVVRTVMGILPDAGEVISGTVCLDGRDLLELDEAGWQRLRGGELSMVFQDAGAMLNPIRSIGSQFVEYVRAHRDVTRSEAGELARGMLTRMGLPDPGRIMRSYPFQLSGGQRQRVGIAMAMTFEPRLLLADEPTSALDVTTQAQIVREMAELRERRGTAILLVTHNLAVATYLADRIVVMRAGRVVDEGTGGELLARPEGSYVRGLLDAVPRLGEVAGDGTR